MPETKLRAMRHRDVWQVVNCDQTGLLKGGGLAHASSAGDIEWALRQQYQRLTVAVDCHNIPRGYMHADCGTKRNVARIKRLVVHGDWWSLGVGRQLMESFQVQCRDAQVDIVCDVPFDMLPAAALFLKKFGFRGTSYYSVNEVEYAAMQWSAVVAAGKAGAA
jgi:ribosomal protein S18 acetylase RimI-like enzyme